MAHGTSESNQHWQCRFIDWFDISCTHPSLRRKRHQIFDTFCGQSTSCEADERKPLSSKVVRLASELFLKRWARTIHRLLNAANAFLWKKEWKDDGKPQFGDLIFAINFSNDNAPVFRWVGVCVSFSYNRNRPQNLHSLLHKMHCR